MKEIFKEYHQFTKEELKDLWGKCLFVMDTNTLLHMYRYSRETVKTYFEFLEELKNKGQLWIPYQVGLEFYENRIDVISEYEKSYDEILSIISKAKSDVEMRYKHHPFLNLLEIKEDMANGLKNVENKITKARDEHPQWLKNDEVLEKVNALFLGNVGGPYSKDQLETIKNEGKIRYEKKIPPGFKDEKKNENKKFGDLILWYQIIDKAKEIRKPIVLISSDIKEDWWLEKNGKRLMPLPQLKKEMFDKASVDFHIYTAENFLELSSPEKPVSKHIIKEVRMIRELEEEKMVRERFVGNMNSIHSLNDGYSVELNHVLIRLEHIISEIDKLNISTNDKDELGFLLRKLNTFRFRNNHGELDITSFIRLRRISKEILLTLDRVRLYCDGEKDIFVRAQWYIKRLEYLIQKSKRIA